METYSKSWSCHHPPRLPQLFGGPGLALMGTLAALWEKKNEPMDYKEKYETLLEEMVRHKSEMIQEGMDPAAGRSAEESKENKEGGRHDPEGGQREHCLQK